MQKIVLIEMLLRWIFYILYTFSAFKFWGLVLTEATEEDIRSPGTGITDG